MNKKDLLASFLSKAHLLPAIKYLRSSTSNALCILAYHRIYDMGNEDEFPFDPELISATPDDFETQMRYVKKHFNPITFKHIIDYQNGNTKLPECPVIITFDDGHLDNYTHAFPVLKKLHIPATIFISTEYMDSDKIFWFDWVAYNVYKTRKKELTLNEGSFFLKIGSGISQKRKSVENLLNHLKALGNNERLAALIEIKNTLNVKLENKDRGKSSALQWRQIVEMGENQIEFGSHTVSHPVLSSLSAHELTQELVQSKTVIEQQLGKSVDTIAYPVGGEDEFNQSVIDECKKASYILGISYSPGIEKLPLRDMYRIKRLHVERYTNIHRFKAMLALPGIFK
ncbi:Polysaccharide deacetylase [hydrothermal vent metagenome]|uniref:Polysaccharide deacetylase n=1 Tax=hydrothermal vent metagenome TaxID=652676 RepID=A0A3B0X2K7_9ZZZZ